MTKLKPHFHEIIIHIDGHGEGVMGVHPLMKTKNWPTPGVKKTVRG